MSVPEETRFHKPTLVLLIAGALTVLLAIAVGVAFLSRPQPVVLTVSGPAGATVWCDFVIDGRAESHRDSVPVTYTYLADSLRFAVITESAAAGNVRVELSGRHGAGTAESTGVEGVYEQGGPGGGMSIGGMTDSHVTSMRAARTGTPRDTRDKTPAGQPSG